MKEKSVLEMRNIHKSFPGVRALQAVDFTLCEGEIHALMGENGAGKSTVIKIITGVYTKDSGEIVYEGREVRLSNLPVTHRIWESARYIRRLPCARILRWLKTCTSDAEKRR